MTMSRPPVIPVEKKIRIVLSIVAGEVTIKEAARKESALCSVDGPPDDQGVTINEQGPHECPPRFQYLNFPYRLTTS